MWSGEDNWQRFNINYYVTYLILLKFTCIGLTNSCAKLTGYKYEFEYRDDMTCSTGRGSRLEFKITWILKHVTVMT